MASTSLAPAAVRSRGTAWLQQLRIVARRPGDLIFRGVTYTFVAAVLIIVAGIVWVLITNSWSSITAYGFSFLTNSAFDPVHNSFGVGPAIFGTIVTSAFAIIFAVPLAVGTAIFLVDFCPRPLRAAFAFLVDTIAALPSVVIGLWGVFVMKPWLQLTGEPWLQQHLGFLPFFQGAPSGFGILAAGIVLVIMILPIITAISREVMLVVPVSQREALVALGATRWEVIRHAVLPFARAGIFGGALLGLGRALGETIAVTMLIGNQASPPSASLFATGYTLSSVIANQFNEATPGIFRSAVIEAGLVLLVMTLITNILAHTLIARMGRRHRVRSKASSTHEVAVATIAAGGEVA